LYTTTENAGGSFPEGVSSFLADEVLVEKPGVDHDPHGHEGVHGRLKLEQNVDVEPGPFPADLPDHVVVPGP
jgi:hypothetical protein